MIKINFRPLFIIFISLIFGIVCLACFNFNFNAVGFVALGALALFLLLSTILFVVGFIKSNNKFLIGIKKFNHIFISVLVGLIFAIITFYISLFSFNNRLIMEDGTNADVSGVISEVKTYNNYLLINVDNLKINNVKANGVLELGITKSENFNAFNFSVGNILEFTTELENVKANYNNVYKMISNVKFRANCNMSNVTVIKGNKSFKVAFKENVFNNLNEVLNNDNANLAYSMLFGEKDNLSEEIFNVFSYSGLAHILAVSGLHIGFLVAMLVGFLNLIKCNKQLRNVIVFLILFIYAYLTNFTPSVVRALIMSMVLLISKTYGKEYDSLSSLSLAGIIILLVNPLSIFSVGFQLSFACVFAIITLSDDFNKMLLKIKCPKNFASALSISLAVNIGVFAITAVHFKTISFISVFSNLIVLPMFSICYVLLFMFTLLVSITNIFSFLLVVPNVLLHFIKLIANFFAEIKILSFNVFHVGYIVVLLMLLLLYLVKFVMAKAKFKAFIGAILLSFVIVLTIVTNIPSTFSSYNVMANYSRYGNNCVITTKENNKILVLNNATNIKYITDLLDKAKINQLDAVICFDYSVKDNYVLNDVVTKLNPEIMIFEKEYSPYIINEFKGKIVLRFYEDNFNLFGIDYSFIKNNNSAVALNANINDENVLFVADSISKYDLYCFTDNYSLIISNNNNLDFKSYGVNYQNLLTYRKTKFESTICLTDTLFFTKTF